MHRLIAIPLLAGALLVGCSESDDGDVVGMPDAEDGSSPFDVESPGDGNGADAGDGTEPSDDPANGDVPTEGGTFGGAVDPATLELLGPLLVEVTPSCLPVGEPFTVNVSARYLKDDLELREVSVDGFVTVVAESEDAFEIVSQSDAGVVARLGEPDIALLRAGLVDAADEDAEGLGTVTAYAPDTPRPSVLVDRGNGGCAVSALSSDGSCSTAITGGEASAQTVAADGAVVGFEGCEVIDNPDNLPIVELGPQSARVR